MRVIYHAIKYVLGETNELKTPFRVQDGKCRPPWQLFSAMCDKAEVGNQSKGILKFYYRLYPLLVTRD